MEQSIKRIGLMNVVAFLVTGGAGLIVARYSHTLAGQAGVLFFGYGLLVAVISYFQMRLEDTERLEKLEFDELTKSRGGSSLFQGTDAEAFPAQRSREQFERFFVPGFTVLLFLLQAGAAYWLFTWLKQPESTALKQPTVAMALFGMFGLVLFLLGKYSAGVARLDRQRLVRPTASYLLLCSYVSFAIAGCVAAVVAGYKPVDLYAARVIAVVVGLVALETLVNLILEIYRPRVKGTEVRLLYDSRLIGLMSQPEGLVTTAAQALDYQFGFKVSETWFYRFLEKRIAWLILIQVLILSLSTSVVFVEPGEEALVERFGRPTSQVFGAGVHFKLPWPLSTVYRFRTEQIQSFNIGAESDVEQEKQKTILWTVSHYKTEFNLLVASRQQGTVSTNVAEQGAPADLLAVNIPVQFQIKDVRAFAYNHTDAGKLLERVATREVIRYLVSVDFFEIMSSARQRASKELQERIQARADELNLGVKIVFVGLQDIHPPVKVAKHYEQVVGTSQENEARMRQSEGYAAKTLAIANAEAQKRIYDAQGYSNRTVAAAVAQGGQFANQIRAWQASPDVFVQRAYLQAIERGITNARKYVIATTNTQEVILLNLEDSIREDLLKLSVPGRR